MKKSIKYFAAIVLGTAALGVQAGRDGQVDMAGCAAELEARYGEDTQFSVVNKRRHRYGTKVQIAVRLDQDTTRFATCWVPGNDIAAREDDVGEALVAAAGQEEVAQ